jgi:hypothetical protein
MTQTFYGSGGWRTNTVRDKTTLGPDIPFLASEKYTVKRSGATFKKASSTAAVNEVQTLTASDASAGDFTLSFGGYTTAALDWDATAAEIQTALQALPSIGVGGATTTGGPAQTTDVVITFAGANAGQNQQLITIDKTGLTAGDDAAVTETTRGNPAGVSEIKKGTFVHPDVANAGYYKAWVSGDTIITDGSVDPPGFLMETINVGDGDVAEGVVIGGSVLVARVQPNPLHADILTAIAGRFILQ